MTVRHAVLCIGAVLVLGLGVYLFVEVRAQPGAPEVIATSRGRPSATDAAAMAAAGRPAPPDPPAPAAPPVAIRKVAAPPPAPAAPAPSIASAEAGAPPEPDVLVGPKLDAAMDEANKAYDRGDYDDAKTLAGRLLARQPGNIRMLRIMVSASCIDGDSAMAQASYARLPPADQAQMRIRCARYGVAFPDRP